MPTPTEKNYHWVFYAISYIASLFIGIDCAINAWAYMSIMHGLLASVPAIVICAIAGFVLNFILYLRDTPSALDNLLQQFQRFHKLSLSEALSIFIALASGLTMALFTYQSYLSLGLSFISPLAVILFSIAYAIGTFALAMPSMDESQENPNLNPIKCSLWVILTALMACTIRTFHHEIFILLSGFIPHAQIATGFLIAFYCLGECIFNYKVASYLVDELVPSINKKNNISIFLLLIALAMLNALGNGAITANGGSYIIAALGALLSLSVMMYAASEVSSKPISITQAQYNGGMAMLYIILPLLAIWIMHTFILPLYCPTLLIPAAIVLAITATSVMTIIGACEYSCSTQKKTHVPSPGIKPCKIIKIQKFKPFFNSILSPLTKC